MARFEAERTADARAERRLLLAEAALIVLIVALVVTLRAVLA